MTTSQGLDASRAAPSPAGRAGFQLTVARALALLFAGLVLVASGALLLAVQAGRAALVDVGEATRRSRADDVAAALARDLAAVPSAVGEVEAALAASLVGRDEGDVETWRRFLGVVLLAHPALVEVTFTHATLRGYDERGQAELEADGRWQLAVFRGPDGKVGTRLVRPSAPGASDDPTRHDTFGAAAHRDAANQLLWSDLAYSELDRRLPEAARRKTLTAQKALFANGRGGPRFVGVLRAGLTSDTLARLGADASHFVFIADTHGRLVTRLGPDEPYVAMDADGRDDEEGDLRVRPAHVPEAVRVALAQARAAGAGSTRVRVGGEPWLITLQDCGEDQPQPWLVGVVVPERVYVGPLVAARNRLLLLFAALALVLAGAAWAGSRTVDRALGALVASTEAMQRFVFVARPPTPTRFHEIRRALDSLERAKTAMRAMVKYVPVDLVRQLYTHGVEPTLGAESRPVTLMFTDIADFTRHAETLPPSLLAEALGRYFDAATAAVEGCHGTVDKYIGDALMVMWNAPTLLPDHARAACRAALATEAATGALETSPWWRMQGLAPWRTRIGLHTGDVLVGNFGAPARLNYTAMGDRVNLAARLEGLNKSYGTSILVSGEVRTSAGEAFLFRLVDRVAVKGKTESVEVYELLASLAADPSDQDSESAARLASLRSLVARYEAALAAAWRRDFTEALTLLEPLLDDGPSRVLATRCRRWLANPPPSGWDGTWVATTK